MVKGYRPLVAPLEGNPASFPPSLILLPLYHRNTLAAMRNSRLECRRRLVTLALLTSVCWGCGPRATDPPPRSAHSQGTAGSAAAAGTPTASEVSPDKPVELRISALTVDPGKTVRIRGTIASVLGIRLVPPKVIFKVSDSTEMVTVVINEQVTLKEGARIELVGKYRNVASPMYTGPGEAPKEAVFVVERFLDLP
jgi:hypothetical protein